MTLSPQLRAIGPEMRVLDAYIDAIAAYGRDCPAVEARVATAILAERRSGEGWQVTAGERMMAERGWRSAEDIFDEAGIPEKHRRALDLALWNDDSKPGSHMFTFREIAELTGHPVRTVERWVAEGKTKIQTLVTRDRSE